MPLPLFVVDAFTDVPFAGNPAAVVLLERAAEPAWMQSVAAEMNLSETAFAFPLGEDRYALRWFTPTSEIPLCGHATLATGAVLHREGRVIGERVTFETASGALHVDRVGARFAMSLPAYGADPVDAASILALLALRPIDVRLSRSKGKKLMVVVETEAEVLAAAPDPSALLAAPNPLGIEGVLLTARGTGDVDFVSRYFAPWVGIAEDPVTGSAHCVLGPYWAKRLGKTSLAAVQVSRRRGVLGVTVGDERVGLDGGCAIVSRGELLA
ncbi:MAG: PhzF family phenazine biosynthesis protein [Polyangiales bacterium]